MPKKILIAEDDTFLQKMEVVSLEEAGFQVIRTNDGEKALAMIQQEKPDLILLDILMPKVDGFTVLDRLQKMNSTIPVIVMSNLGQEGDVAKCKALGAKDYFIKSNMEPGDLVEHAKKFIA